MKVNRKSDCTCPKCSAEAVRRAADKIEEIGKLIVKFEELRIDYTADLNELTDEMKSRKGEIQEVYEPQINEIITQLSKLGVSGFTISKVG